MPGRTARAPRPDPLPAPSGARDPDGEVAEWSKAPHSKCGVRATVPWVRIPPSPPSQTVLSKAHQPKATIAVRRPFRPVDRHENAAQGRWANQYALDKVNVHIAPCCR